MKKIFTNTPLFGSVSHIPSSRRVSVRDIGRLFIPRTTTLRGDGKGVKGFTLIELLVVVLIIGILAAIALPQYQRSVDKAKYTQAMILVEKIWQAEQIYKMANGDYSVLLRDFETDLPVPLRTDLDTSDGDFFVYSWGNCSIHGTGYIRCTISLDNGSAWYFAWPHRTDRRCWAYPKENARANALCKAVTGKATGTENDNYMMYSF